MDALWAALWVPLTIAVVGCTLAVLGGWMTRRSRRNEAIAQENRRTIETACAIDTDERPLWALEHEALHFDGTLADQVAKFRHLGHGDSCRGCLALAPMPQGFDPRHIVRAPTYIEYTVQRGDTMQGIAKTCGVPLREVTLALRYQHALTPGAVLRIGAREDRRREASDREAARYQWLHGSLMAVTTNERPTSTWVTSTSTAGVEVPHVSPTSNTCVKCASPHTVRGEPEPLCERCLTGRRSPFG